MTEAYRRYLEARIREAEPYPGLPIILTLRARARDVGPTLILQAREIALLLRLVAIWKICAKRRENVFAEFYAVGITQGARLAQRFFPGSDRTWKISSLSVSRSQRSEKSRNAPVGKRASALGKANCLGAIARIRVGIRRKQPRQFVQHSW